MKAVLWWCLGIALAAWFIAFLVFAGPNDSGRPDRYYDDPGYRCGRVMCD